MSQLSKARNVEFVLASQSPRRQAIFKSLGLNYRVQTFEVEEEFPTHLQSEDIPLYLAKLKAEPHLVALKENEILVTADTVVWINDHVLNKPINLIEAKAMLHEIAGSTHRVYTAVCLSTNSSQYSFAEMTEVVFHELSEEEIDFYLENYSPLDKAGAYGIQEFIGYIGIKEVHGDFYNVVGFPVQRFWKELASIL
jgi:septum formation protein